MLQLVNNSPFSPGMFLFPDESGVDTLYAVVKATFDLSAERPALADAQQPVVMADEYFGAPEQSSLKYASEAHLMKPGTDVAVVGEAFSPGEKAVTTLDVSVTVKDRTIGILVWGERQWQGTALKAWPSYPEPFVRMPVVYERAFGGMQIIETSDSAAEVLSEPTNPVGRGFRGNRDFDEIKQEPVPNIENPEQPIASLRAMTPPMGFGFIAPWWAPRMHFAGTYDTKWQKRRAPYLPEDFDPRFFNTASEGLVFEEGLKGGESVCITHMSPKGELAFEIPRLSVGIDVTVAGKTETPKPNLETILIEPNEERLVMTFRAAVPCDKRALEVSEVRIEG